MAKKNHYLDEKRRKENTCAWNSEHSCQEKTVNSICKKSGSAVGTCVVTGFTFDEPKCNCQ
jgi:hypothetical protein